MRVVLVAISVLTSISLQPKTGIGAQDSDFTAGIFGRELPADAPTKYREDYLLAPSSISPDKKLALIYSKEGDEFPTQPESGTADNYLVTLDPFRILGALPVAYFENINHKRSEEHTSELQSPCNLVCRLLLEKKKRQL